MVDLQVIEIRDVLKVNSIAAVPASNPPTLLITGQDFNSAQHVLINETESPSIVVISSKEILAQMPTTQINMPIRTIVIISHRLTRTDRSHITFGLGDSPQSVAGITMLVQHFLKLMLQTPGTDIFSPNLGGALLSASGRQIANPNASTLVADLNLAVNRARQQLMSIQARNTRLSMAEKLAYARVVDATFNTTELALIGRVAIGNQASQSSVVGLGL